MSAGDNWCTDQRELDIVASICGVREWDLDPASNPHSRVMTRVACHGGPALARLLTLPFSAYPGGRVRAKVDGTSFVWPAEWTVWNNPPYSDPAPWVAQMIYHAGTGGRGSAILPGCLDTSWGQAVLKARDHADAAMQIVLRANSAKATAASAAFEELWWDCEAAGAPACDLLSNPRWQVLMLRKRVSFRDPLRPYIGPVPGNRGSSMLLFWGFDPLTCDPNLGEWL